MQVLYVTSFDIAMGGQSESGDAGGKAAYARVLHHVAGWLGPDFGSSLESPGSATLPQVGLKPKRAAAWEVQRARDVEAVRLELSQPHGSGDEVFVTTVTVARNGAATRLRVAMGQRITSDWLAPAKEASLYQPRLTGLVCRDASLVVRVLGQRVDGRYDRIREAATVEVLAEAVETPSRLPIVLAHPRSDIAWQAIGRAAQGLIGLAKVVTLNYSTSHALASLHSDLAVPDGGVRLVWPGRRFLHPALSRQDVEGGGEDGLRAHLMETLAGLSVVARGSDNGWGLARRAVLREQEDAARKESESARASGNSRREISALQAQVAKVSEAAEFWENAAEELESKVADLAPLAEAAERFRRERDSWREAFEETRRAAPSPEADPWEAIPALESHDAAGTFRDLEVASEGRLVFTPAAERSWTASRYPYPKEMTDVLVTLAKASIDLYSDQQAGKMPRLDDWFKTEHGLNVAFSDLELKKKPKLRFFEFEGPRDGLPHVKVRDAVSPNEVGRIYFALDPAGRRIIVDHVGLKKIL
ncbi:hypothetical protein ACTVZO_26665 [Streptomyces sp. IBSNAI002]|uniref:hypothetical protein n=1 Tax=Streptomyces sp. IBSNAI002 TaxID=3457500 RepID=UPI003FD41564